MLLQKISNASQHAEISSYVWCACVRVCCNMYACVCNNVWVWVCEQVQEYMQRSPGQSSTDPVPNHNHDGDGDGGGDASYLDLNAMAFPRELSLASNASHDEYLDSVAPPPQSLDAGGIHTLAPQPHAQTTPSVSVPMHGRPGRRPALVSSQTEGTYPTPPQHHHHHHHQNQHHDAPLPINYGMHPDAWYSCCCAKVQLNTKSPVHHFEER